VGQAIPNNLQWILEEKLGEGGFGEVWVAQNPRLKERHVFKFCFRADRVRTLKRELTLFKVLKEHVGEHPNVVRLFDVYLEEPPFYLEEEFVEGKDLKRWLEQQGGIAGVPLETRLEVVAQAGEALQAAHDAGIIHRDVKPGNILVCGGSADPKSLRVKLTDFGIGQITSAAVLSGVTLTGFTQTLLSSTSSQTGTHLYMAPELLSGKPTSARSDLYSLGVVLLQLLTGDLRQAVAIDWAKPIKDPILREDLERCLAGNPEERFEGAGQLARNLRDLSQRRATAERLRAEKEEQTRLRHQAERRRQTGIAAAAFAGVLLLVALALAFGLFEAKKARALQRVHTYASDMKAAQTELVDQNLGMAVSLLGRYEPQEGENDVRGIEWRSLWQRSHGDEIMSLSGPTASSKDAALSPDGRLLATVGFDGKIRIYDLEAEVYSFVVDGGGTPSPKKSVAFAPNSSWFAMRGKNGIELRSTEDWSVIDEIPDLSVGSPFALSGDGNVLSYVNTNGGLRTWNLSERTEHQLPNAPAALMNLTLDAVGSRVAYCQAIPLFGGRAPLCLWDVQRGVKTELATREDVTSLTISPDDRWLASGHWSGQVCFWDLQRLQPVARFQAHRGFIYALTFSPDGQSLVTGGSDQQIHAWVTGTTNLLWTQRGHVDVLYALGFSPTGQRLVSAGGDAVKIWRVPPIRPYLHSFSVPREKVPLGFLADETALLTVSTNGTTAQIWRLPDGELVETCDWEQADGSPLKRVRFVPGANAAVGVSEQGALYVRDLVTGDVRSTGISMDPSWSPLHLSPNRRWLLANGPYPGLLGGVRLHLFDLDRSHQVKQFQFFYRWTFGAAFDAKSRWLAFSFCQEGEDAQSAAVWDLSAGHLHRTLGSCPWPISALAFSPKAEMVAAGDWDCQVHVWDLDSGQLRFAQTGHIPAVGSLCFSADGQTLASSGADFTVRLWNVRTGREMLKIQQALMVSGRRHSGGAESALAMGSHLFPADRWLAYQDLEGMFHFTDLPDLAEIDAQRTRTK
jgi:WD40 repeat protein/tRNA A-37 threonylcarbamoyl transferase component Bud32